jgi:Big-like domain-containing protein/concanavalin A-like lectin/glucanase superfamily protein
MKNIKSKLFYYIFAGTALMLFAVNISCEKEEDEVGDIVNPYVISYNPVPGVGGVDLSSNLVLTFDDIIEIGTGSITITVADVPSATQVIDVTSDKVTLSNVGRIMTINPQDFLSGREYKVVIEQGIVRDTIGNAYFGMPDGENWTFTSGGNPGDLDAPAIAELSPAAGSTDAAITSLGLSFNEDVKEGTGNITVYNGGGVAVATIDVEGGLLSIDGSSISIPLADPLNFGEGYYVIVDNGAIKDIAGNPFAGYADSGDWAFTTTAGSGSELVFHLPMDTDLKDDSGNKFDAVLGPTASAAVDFVDDATRGSVARFNAGAYAILPKHDLLRPSDTQSFSINLWLKLAGTDSDPAIIANKDWGSGGNPGWLLCTDDGHEYAPGNGTDHGWIVNNAGNPKMDGNRMDWKAAGTTPQAPALSDDQWHMATMVWDQNNKVLEVYIDGVRYGDTSYDLSVLTGSLWDEVNDYPLTLWEDGTGGYNASDDRRAAMTGLMDELSYYNKVLTPDDIATLFNN